MSALIRRMPFVLVYILACSFSGVGLVTLYADATTLKPASNAQSKLNDQEYNRYVGLIDRYNKTNTSTSKQLSNKEQYLQENARLSALSSIKQIEKRHQLAFTDEVKKNKKADRIDSRLKKALELRDERKDNMEKTRLYLEKLNEKKHAVSQN